MLTHRVLPMYCLGRGPSKGQALLQGVAPALAGAHTAHPFDRDVQGLQLVFCTIAALQDVQARQLLARSGRRAA